MPSIKNNGPLHKSYTSLEIGIERFVKLHKEFYGEGVN
jgi:hypothetical protein